MKQKTVHVEVIDDSSSGEEDNQQVVEKNPSTAPPKITTKMKLRDLQLLAEEHDIALSSGVYTNGNKCMKTKKDLYQELKKKFK